MSSSCCLQQFSDLHPLFGKFSSVVPYCMMKISQTKAITHIHWHSLSQHVINFCQFTIIWCKKKASSYLLTDLKVQKNKWTKLKEIKLIFTNFITSKLISNVFSHFCKWKSNLLFKKELNKDNFV